MYGKRKKPWKRRAGEWHGNEMLQIFVVDHEHLVERKVSHKWEDTSHEWADIWVTNEKTNYDSRWQDASWVTNEMLEIFVVDHEHLVEREVSHECMSHEWEDTPWVTNEKTQYESRMRCFESFSSIMSIWLRERRVTNESRMRGKIMSHESRMKKHMMSHEWENTPWHHEWDDTIWVTNEEKKLESRVRRHMSHEWKDISWVTNEWPAKVCCTVLQCVAVCCSVLQRVAVCGSVLQRVCCSDMMSHERVTCSGVMPKSTTSPCAYSRYITRHMKWVTNERGHMSHEWEDTGWVTNYTIHHHTDDVLWVTNEEAYHESRIRGHMSHDWEETWWVTNEETYHESQIRGHMSHEWEETWWVTNEETYHESRIRGHMSHEWEDT